MSITQQITRRIKMLAVNFQEAMADEQVDGFVAHNQALMRHTQYLIKGVVHLTKKNGMEPQEIADDLNIAIEQVNAILAEPLDLPMEVGSIVNSKDPNGDPLHCGSGCYPYAIVISMEPYVLVSDSGDMRWGARKAENMEVIGKATPEMLAICMKRLES